MKASQALDVGSIPIARSKLYATFQKSLAAQALYMGLLTLDVGSIPIVRSEFRDVSKISSSAIVVFRFAGDCPAVKPL